MTEIRRYAILTPFARADLVAAIMHLSHLDAWAVPTNSGALVVRELATPKYDEWDIRNITGPDPDEEPATPSDDAVAVAAQLSRLSPYGVVLMDVNLDDSDTGFEAGVSGMVRARRFQGGKPGDVVPSGLLLNSLDPVVERLVLGDVTPEKSGGIHTTEVTGEQLERLRRGTNDVEQDGSDEAR